ncbi:fumarylacetoacetate hydrolase family protein [Candidatus Sumerlaeota bacterium]|nr:fumarylacetoacetate hydrolase family protein [Candidatus Sumerlaeota bacterium]
MKIVRFYQEDREKPRWGVLTDRGLADAAVCWNLYALKKGSETPEFPGSPLELLRRGTEAIDYLRDAVAWVERESPERFLPADRVRLLPPIADPPKILCIGQNYRDHCEEQGVPVPKSPVIFAKFRTALSGPGDPIVLPRISEKVDYEAELGVAIARGGRHIPSSEALEHVGGYLNFNDVSARDLQFGDGQWVRGKSCDTFAPMGPWLVTRDEIPDPQNLSICCRVNGEALQQSNTNQMVFSVAELIAFVSQTITLETGDVIATGTPPGVGVFRKPPRLLKPGDRVEVEIEGLGTLVNPVVAE